MGFGFALLMGSPWSAWIQRRILGTACARRVCHVAQPAVAADTGTLQLTRNRMHGIKMPAERLRPERKQPPRFGGIGDAVGDHVAAVVRPSPKAMTVIPASPCALVRVL